MQNTCHITTTLQEKYKIPLISDKFITTFKVSSDQRTLRHIKRNRIITHRMQSSPFIEPTANIDIQSSTVNVDQSTDFTDPVVLASLPPERFLPVFERTFLSTPEQIRSCIHDLLGVPIGSDVTKLNLSSNDVNTEAWVENFELAIFSFGLSGFYNKGVWPTSAKFPRFTRFVRQLVTNLRSAFDEPARSRFPVLRSNEFDIKQIIENLTTVPFNPRAIGHIYSVRFNQPPCSNLSEALTSYLACCKMLDSTIDGKCYLGFLRSAIANCSNQFDKSLVQVIQPLMSNSSLANAHPLDIHKAILNSAHIDSFEFTLQSVKQKNPRPRKGGDQNGTQHLVPSTALDNSLAALSVSTTTTK